MVWTKGEESCALSIICQAPDPVYRWDGLTRNVFCSHIPYPSLAIHFLLAFDNTQLKIRTSASGYGTHPSEYCIILPFLDQANQLSPDSTLSLLFRIRIVFGVSAVGGFEILHTRRSPSEVCVANMSDFCLVEEACHAKFAIGEGARGVVSVCKIVNVGCRDTIRIEPFKYLYAHKKSSAKL